MPNKESTPLNVLYVILFVIFILFASPFLGALVVKIGAEAAKLLLGR